MNAYARKHASAAAAAIALAAVLAGCSGAPEEPAAEPAGSTSDVTVSTAPESPTPTPSASASDQSDDFETAVEFTRLTHEDKNKEASRLVVPESPAARYLAHQVLIRKARIIARVPDQGNFPTVKADRKTQSIGIVYPTEEPVEGEKSSKPLTYTWQDFTFDQGKVTGWTGASGPVKDVLWTRQTTAKSEGRKAVLKSAYLANSKSVWITVELSSRVETGFASAEYAAEDGYRHGMVEQYASELSEGEKTLAYFVVVYPEFGGTLHIPYTDVEGFDEGELVLTIK